MKITLYDHPFSPTQPQVFEADSLGEWLLGHYGEVLSVNVQIFTGQPCAENEITNDVNSILTCNAPEIVVLQSPGDPVSILINIAISFVLSLVAQALAPSPKLPENVNRTQSSPNNALGDRSNQVRLLQRVEDVYGTVKAIPSLMAPTYVKYITNQKFEYGFYCVGRGYYNLAELRDGDTLISDIPGASAAVYNPFTSPNSGTAPVQQIGPAIIDRVVSVRRAIEVDGITLKALNQIQLPVYANYRFTASPSGDTISQDRLIDNIIRTVSGANFSAIVQVGGSIVVGDASYKPTATGSITADAATNSFIDASGSGLFSGFAGSTTISVTGFGSPSNAGTFTVSSVSANAIVVTGRILVDEVANATVTSSATVDYSGVYTVAAVTDSVVTLTTSRFTKSSPTIRANVQIGNVDRNTAWVTLKTVDRTEVYVNVVAANGLYKDNGGKSTASVNFAIEVEQLTAALVPTGNVQTVPGYIDGQSSDERGQTIDIVTTWVGPARVRMRRTSDYDYAFKGTIQDEIKWVDLYSVSPVTKTDFGNKTTIQTVTQANARATAVKTRQLNCLASRLLPIYNGASFSGAFDAEGRLASGTLGMTSKLVDIFAAVAVDPKIGARTLANDIDLAQIYGVQQQLDAWNPKAGQFNYTLDSDNISFEETAVMIANAGFCIAYRQNGKIRFSLDQLQANSAAIFTHRNKKPDSETITRKFASDAEFDGVEFIYTDPDTQHSETIKLPLNGNYTKLKKFEIPGIRSFTQAWFRANREYYKLIGQRQTIETTATLDACSLLPNSRISIVDNTRFKSYDGEIVNQSGLEITLSRDVAFATGQPHSVVLMRRDGSLQSITVTAGSAANKLVLQYAPSEAIVTTYGADGIRTIFSFAADVARGVQAYLVQELDITDSQYVTVKAVNYSDDYYQADFLPVPDKASIIN